MLVVDFFDPNNPKNPEEELFDAELLTLEELDLVENDELLGLLEKDDLEKDDLELEKCPDIGFAEAGIANNENTIVNVNINPKNDFFILFFDFICQSSKLFENIIS